MKVIKEVNETLNSNCYIVINDMKKALIIDLSFDFCQIAHILEREGAKPVGVVFTHGHYDHVYGARNAVDSGLELFISKEDSIMLEDDDKNLASRIWVLDYDPVKDYNILSEGEVDINGFSLKVMKTPGHTKGSVCLLIGENLFSGDTFFKGTIGRTDFPSGSEEDMKTSVNRLIALDFDYKVYAGHGEATTLFKEIKTNPYFIKYRND